MGKIKAAAIITTGIVGGIVGGVIAVAGKNIGNKTVNEIGDSVIESTLLTGDIVGDVIEGIAETAIGTASGNDVEQQIGTEKLKSAGGKVIGNVVGNVKLVGGAVKDVAVSTAKNDKVKKDKALKRLIKVVSTGFITVGAIKIKDEKK